MRGDKKLYELLYQLGISFEYHEHPEAPTIEIAMEYWKNIPSVHCKNLFFRNHKGNRHYLVVLEGSRALDIRDLEQRLRQGKLSLSSPERLYKYLKLKPGSVSPFGLIHDEDKHVHLFIDQALAHVEQLCFHPNDNTASLVIKNQDFKKFLDWCGNSREYIRMYDEG